VKLIGERILFHPLQDGDTCSILDEEVTFFDIQSEKAKQYGFQMVREDGRRLVFAGDEPYRDCEKQYVEGADYLLHEAFCLYSEREKFKPYEKFHTTVQDACQMAEALGVKTLFLYHTEDQDLEHRKERYLAEGKTCFSGKLYVPDDLERFAV
jgi:ribonuclease Z